MKRNSEREKGQKKQCGFGTNTTYGCKIYCCCYVSCKDNSITIEVKRQVPCSGNNCTKNDHPNTDNILNFFS